MSKINSYPKVAIVGRTNVGKSTLFNRLTHTNKSMVFDQEGVTRDYIHELVSWNDKTFDLIDTGGLLSQKTDDQILKEVQQSITNVIEQKADVLLFVCDGKNGLTEQDRLFAKTLHKSKKPVILILNKCDHTSATEENQYEFAALGFKDMFLISATHGSGIRELLEAITENLPEVTGCQEELAYSITILGKPNVGKSSLLNLLLDEQRAIVSDVAGTTREAISEKVYFHKDLIQITDTAGIRKKAGVEDPLEISMVKNALNAVRNADIVLLLVDCSDGQISDQELKLLFYADEQKKSIILIFNKTDKMEEYAKQTIEQELEKYDFFLKKVPILWISCLSQKNVGKVFKEIKAARERRLQEFSEKEINEVVKEAWMRKPMFHKTIPLKLAHVKPIKTERKIPTFILYVNFPAWFGPTQLGYIEAQIRKNFDLLGCPIQLIPQKI